MKSGRQMTFGMIVGNRGFFPDHLAKEGREEMLKVLEGAGIRVIARWSSTNLSSTGFSLCSLLSQPPPNPTD